MANLAQSYSEQKLVLASIEGGGKEATAPEPADLLLGIESMQKTYTGFFSGAESTNLPPEVEKRLKKFEHAFTHMADLATNLAGFQQQISRAIAANSTVPATGGTTVVLDGAAVPGGVAAIAEGTGAIVANEGKDAEPAAVGGQAVEQAPPAQPPAESTGARPLSPDRAGGAGGATASVFSGLIETRLRRPKRADKCTSEELMQRRPPPNIGKGPVGPVGAQAMEVEGDAAL